MADCKKCIHSDICIFIEENPDCIQFRDRADVVEVVRCKECKHNVANWQHDELDEEDYTDITCDYFMTDGMEADDFCSYGERNEE